MSLIPFTSDIKRDTPTPTAGGGETQAESTPYSGLRCTFNYKQPKQERVALAASSRQAIGPGARTVTSGVVIFDPKPSGVTILVDDRVVPNPAVAGVPSALDVVGVRTYETTLQLDVEAVA